MKKAFHLAIARGRLAWILLILALLSLPTATALAARPGIRRAETAASPGSSFEEPQIPNWAEPLDPNFSNEDNVPVTYDPIKKAVEQDRIPDCKSCPPDETNPNDDPSRWPSSTTVKVIATWPSADTTECSGVLVAESTILTAGHCVFTHNAAVCEGAGSCWAADLQIFTDYETQDQEESGYTSILTWTAWTQNRDFNYDLAGVRLAQPFGNAVGWLGFGYNKDTQNEFYPGKTFEHASYSGNRLLTWRDEFTKIDEHQFYSDDPSVYGQSGAGAHSNEYFHIVYSVLSHHRSVESTIKTAHTRITPLKFFALRDWIKGSMDDLDFTIYMPLFAD